MTPGRSASEIVEPFWTIAARYRTFTPEHMSSNRSLTKSQARSLLSIARWKIARSRLDPAISSRTRMDQTCFGLRGFFWPISNPLFQGRWLLSALKPLPVKFELA